MLCTGIALVLLAGCAMRLPSGAADQRAPTSPNAAVAAQAPSRPDRDLEMSKAGERIPAASVQEVKVPADKPAFGTVELLAYADRLRAMSPAETAAEIARLSDRPDARHAMFSNLQLAVALTQTRSSQDTLRAQTLLQRVLAHGDDEARALHPLARLLASRVADLRRLEDQVDKQAQQLRDSQRRIDQLNERLEAVRAIERSLTRNGNPLAAPAVPVTPNPAGAARP